MWERGWSSLFLGQYEYRIDQKGRIAIPPKFREEFREGLIAVRGFEKCIVLYPPREWEKVAERFAALPATRSRSRRISRFTFSSAFDLELDGQGRIALPQPLRQYAEIKEIVVIAGLNTCIEIWDKELWEAERVLMDEQAWQIAESFEARS